MKCQVIIQPWDFAFLLLWAILTGTISLMKYISEDTTEDAAVKQISILQSLSGSERVKIAFELSKKVRDITLSGIRHRHPEYDEQMVKYAWFKLTLSPELFSEAFPGIRSRTLILVH